MYRSASDWEWVGGVIVSLALLGVAPTAHGALALYEPFDYAVGTELKDPAGPDASHTWAEVNTNATVVTDVPTVVAGSLTLPSGLPAAVGNSETHGSSGHTSRLNLSGSYASGRVYWSAAVRVDTTTIVANGQILALNNGTGTQTGNVTQMLADLWVKRGSGSNKFLLGIGKNAAVQTYMAAADEVTTGTTMFVVGAYDFGPNDPTDAVADNQDGYALLWINPDPATFGADTPPGATLSSIPAAINDISSIQSIALYQYGNTGGTSATGNATVDEIRVATTWAEVTGAVLPEPGSLGGTAMLALVGMRRRRRC